MHNYQFIEVLINSKYPIAGKKKRLSIYFSITFRVHQFIAVDQILIYLSQKSIFCTLKIKHNKPSYFNKK